MLATCCSKPSARDPEARALCLHHIGVAFDGDVCNRQSGQYESCHKFADHIQSNHSAGSSSDDPACRQEDGRDDQTEEEAPDWCLHGVEENDIAGSCEHAAPNARVPRVRDLIVVRFHDLDVDIRLALVSRGECVSYVLMVPEQDGHNGGGECGKRYSICECKVAAQCLSHACTTACIDRSLRSQEQGLGSLPLAQVQSQCLRIEDRVELEFLEELGVEAWSYRAVERQSIPKVAKVQ